MRKSRARTPRRRWRSPRWSWATAPGRITWRVEYNLIDSSG